MGQNSSRKVHSNRYLMVLPDIYVRNDASGLYQLKTNGYCEQQQISSSLNNGQSEHYKYIRRKEMQQRVGNRAKNNSSATSSEPPSFLKHHTIVLNKAETQPYLNHLIYRNQNQFKQFFAQVPFGEVQTNQKYTKVHLYAEDIFLTLNQVFNIPFNDMCVILYTSLIAYRYLYSYFGLFKIQSNMIGFTRDSKVKVWLNHKLTKDKPMPIVSDINLKRYKQEQSYMVDDLLNIFWNKVDRDTIPNDFDLLRTFSNIRNSRLSTSRLIFSHILADKDLTQSMVSSLENNLILDFSDRSFDRCLQYLEGYLLIERPQFVSSEQSGKDQSKVQPTRQNEPAFPHIKHRYTNFLPCIQKLIKAQKYVAQATDFSNSKVNININLKQNCYKPHQLLNLWYSRPAANSFSTQLSVPSSNVNFKYTSSVFIGVSTNMQQKSEPYLKPELQKRSKSVNTSASIEKSKTKLSFKDLLPISDVKEALNSSYTNGQTMLESVNNIDQQQIMYNSTTSVTNSASNSHIYVLNSHIGTSRIGSSYKNKQDRSISGPIDSNLLNWSIQEEDIVPQKPIIETVLKV